jgi:hypothetical protein
MWRNSLGKQESNHAGTSFDSMITTHANAGLDYVLSFYIIIIIFIALWFSMLFFSWLMGRRMSNSSLISWHVSGISAKSSLTPCKSLNVSEVMEVLASKIVPRLTSAFFNAFRVSGYI